MEKTLIQKAMEFALSSHEGQYRKKVKIPYFTHVMEVMKACSAITTDEDTLCAAILHDYIEDCDTMLTIEEKYTVLCEMFNPTIADLVMQCTRIEGDDATRKEKYDFLVTFSPDMGKSDEAKLIKLMDRFANVNDYFTQRKNPEDNYYSKYAMQAIPLMKNFIDSENPYIRSVINFLQRAITELVVSEEKAGVVKKYHEYTEEEILKYIL